MSKATITSKGQITIPKDVRHRLGVDAGDRIEFVEIEPGVFKIIPATADVTELKGIVTKPKHSVTIEQMNKAIRKRAGREH
ncbi:MAG: AbrB/MazE/SpoVT family DNA-binding domain-containing protein [Gammaproteobacteria bacterium]|nr:AbrB/MazE/SpoVT family DNA-binding domain-containing protein [Gammaproteobacteria bacterium]